MVAFLYLQVLVKELVKEMDLYYEMQDSSIISRTDLLIPSKEYFLHKSTQSTPMNETPGARMRVSHVSLS